MSKHCPSCNHPTTDEIRYCQYCGAILYKDILDRDLTYRVYTLFTRTIAVVRFSTVEQFDLIPSFRFRLHNIVKKVTGLEYRIDTGVYKDIDVYIKYFYSKDANAVNTYYSKPWPGCFSSLFLTRYYREHKSEEVKVKSLIQIEIDTSHDGPWILVMKCSFNEDEAAQLVEQAGDELQLNMVRSTTSSGLEHLIKP